MQTPDVTKAQIIALVQGVLAAVIAFGILNISPEQETALVGLSAAIGSAIVLADSIIRHGRSRVAAAQVIQTAAGQSPLADPTLDEPEESLPPRPQSEEPEVSA